MLTGRFTKFILNENYLSVIKIKYLHTKNFSGNLYSYERKLFSTLNATNNSINSKNYKKDKFASNLYIPNKDLLFINHPKHGRVYPVYVADVEYNKKHNPKKYIPLTLLFSGFNLFLLFSGLQIFPVTHLYELVYSNDLFFISSVMLNYLLLRKYFKFVGNYDNRVKCLYLLPSGDSIIIETFEGEVKKFENLDIYEFNIRNKFSDIVNKTIKWNPLLVNNDNNFTCFIKWGRTNENFFEGKTTIFDYEIFSQIVSRTNVDTTIKKYKKQMPLGFYSNQDKIKILRNFKNKTIVKKLDSNRLIFWYNILRKKYVIKKKSKVIKKEFNFY